MGVNWKKEYEEQLRHKEDMMAYLIHIGKFNECMAWVQEEKNKSD